MFLAKALQRHFISLTTEKYLVEITLLLQSQNSFSQSCKWLWVCQASILEGAEILFSSMSERFVGLKASVQCGLANPYLLTYLLTPWSRVLLEKLTGSAASQEIPHIFGTRKFITVLTSARHLCLS